MSLPEASIPQQPRCNPFVSPPFPFPSPLMGMTPWKTFGTKDARGLVLEHFGHRNWHLCEPGFLTVSATFEFQVSKKDVHDHLTEIPHFRCVITACQCYKLFDRGWLAVALHYTELQAIFLPPPEISVTQLASFPAKDECRWSLHPSRCDNVIVIVSVCLVTLTWPWPWFSDLNTRPWPRCSCVPK